VLLQWKPIGTVIDRHSKWRSARLAWQRVIFSRCADSAAGAYTCGAHVTVSGCMQYLHNQIPVLTLNSHGCAAHAVCVLVFQEMCSHDRILSAAPRNDTVEASCEHSTVSMTRQMPISSTNL